MLRDTLRKSFTLIELLVVVAIIAVLVAIGIPTYEGFLAQTRESQLEQTCSNVRTDIESAIFFCSYNPDSTLPIISTAKKTPCSWENNGIALYMYQKHTAIAKTIPHPAGWGPVSVVGFNKGNMPFRGGPGRLANGYPIAIKYVTNQKYDYIELTCNDFYNPPYPVTVYNFNRKYH